MSESTVLVHLTDDELVLLDGRCRDEVQDKVHAALARIAMRSELPDLTPAQAGLVSDVVTAAREHGRLRYMSTIIDWCHLCKTHLGYALYKSGPRKGEKNHSKPRFLPAIDMDPRFVHIKHHAGLGGCSDCVTPIVGVIAEQLRGVPAQVPDKLRAEGEPVRLRHNNVECTKCGWEGHEGQMRRKRTLMGDGTYPAGCPECDAENGFGRTLIETTEGFTVVEVAA